MQLGHAKHHFTYPRTYWIPAMRFWIVPAPDPHPWPSSVKTASTPTLFLVELHTLLIWRHAHDDARVRYAGA